MATAKQLITRIEAGEFDGVFGRLYAHDAAVIETQRKRYIQTIQEFEECFGEGRDLRIYSAPGRTELGGNHTDHNNGVVMAAGVNLDIIAVVSKNDNNVINFKSKGFGRIDGIDLNRLEPVESEASHSAALIRGVAAGVAKVGGKVGGFDAFSTSDVLRGSGLSSSAAFEVVVGAILRGEYNNGDETLLSQVELAKIGQYAENVFFGKPCGLMDQTASAVGGVVAIDFADTDRPMVEGIGLDLRAEGYALCILDSGADHADLTAEYAAITGELKAVSGYFGKSYLRDVPEQEFLAALPAVRKAAGDRGVLRAFHFYAENQRAADEADALRTGNFERFLALVRASGRSSALYLQNVIPTGQTVRQELMVTIALCERLLAGRGAVRVHGGGFGGTAQAFVPLDALAYFKAETEAVLGAGSCHVAAIRPVGGVRLG
ncbi:MAG: galactokinase [Agathobaculum sp.]|uniref:galactokinase n=1 Tax=Agathobaculum sp. TaxID=2048138 RepID=UPI0025BF2F95|nr:galactokinase family protein [Agathobaculum sp.]MCI7125980.1 galactokinase [Agathobaculum sp.]